MRDWCTTRSGERFSERPIEEVWQKAQGVPGSRTQRVDVCGATMERDQYGQQTAHGWEIDHVIPVSRHGTDDLDNLQPLHWRNNRSKGDEIGAKQTWCHITR
ncbi:MAG: HNH endonuclease [Candidatus Eisenbacteria sp.]|nr:HNH endonuclease [Candidatus Eisenbacteria bacterium]